jgi:hypothetical protein
VGEDRAGGPGLHADLRVDVYLARNGLPSTLTEDEAVALVRDVLVGRLETVESLAGGLSGNGG